MAQCSHNIASASPENFGKFYDAVWTAFSGNHVEAPAVALVESACPEIMHKDFVTHCAQLLGSAKV